MLPATSGLAPLVPPSSIQPGSCLDHQYSSSSYESATHTGVAVLATAATSLSVRLAQPVSVCQVGLGSYALQPPLVPDASTGRVSLASPQTVSDHPRALFARSKA